MDNNLDNFQLHRFTRSENIAKKVLGGLLVLTGAVYAQCDVFVQNQTLPALSGPIRNTTTPLVSQPHTAQYLLNNHSITSSSNSWKNSAIPAITPVVPMLPPPIVIAPIDTALDPANQALDPQRLLSHLEATNGCMKAPAVTMTTETCGKVPRPITGRGCRDQLLATTTANTKVGLYLLN